MIDYPPIWLEFTPWTISRQHWETSERWGRVHMGFSKRTDTILNWTELTPSNACTPVTCTVQMSEYCQFMIIIYTNHKTLIYNITINKGQSYVFSKSESFWLACLMRAVKIHQLSKTSAELVIFTDFHGLDNGRTYSHKLSKNVAPTPIPNRFERSIQLQCGRWRGVGGIWTSTFTVCNRERSPWDKSYHCEWGKVLTGHIPAHKPHRLEAEPCAHVGGRATEIHAVITKTRITRQNPHHCQQWGTAKWPPLQTTGPVLKTKWDTASSQSKEVKNDSSESKVTYRALKTALKITSGISDSSNDSPVTVTQCSDSLTQSCDSSNDSPVTSLTQSCDSSNDSPVTVGQSCDSWTQSIKSMTQSNDSLTQSNNI